MAASASSLQRQQRVSSPLSVLQAVKEEHLAVLAQMVWQKLKVQINMQLSHARQLSMTSRRSPLLCQHQPSTLRQMYWLLFAFDSSFTEMVNLS